MSYKYGKCPICIGLDICLNHSGTSNISNIILQNDNMPKMGNYWRPYIARTYKIRRLKRWEQEQIFM